jgi:hypothetical protein
MLFLLFRFPKLKLFTHFSLLSALHLDIRAVLICVRGPVEYPRRQTKEHS